MILFYFAYRMETRYCYNCQKFQSQKAYLSCIKRHHKVIEYDDRYKYTDIIANEDVDDVDQANYEIWKRRFIEPDDEEIEVYDYSKGIKDNLCPEHGKKAFGFCIDCDRLICFEEKSHFSHHYILFRDYDINNDIIDNEEDDDFENNKSIVSTCNNIIATKDNLRKISFELPHKRSGSGFLPHHPC